MINVTRSIFSQDRTSVSEEALLNSSRAHISDVAAALGLFQAVLTGKAAVHDWDKLSDSSRFHAGFVTGFTDPAWWDNHRKIHRHHLAEDDGIPDDVNLLDVLEYVADCVVSGMARSSAVRPLAMDAALLMRAFENTVELLKSNVTVA